MSAPLASSIRYQDARLVADPTSLGAGYPYGGTELGAFAEVRFYPGLGTARIRAEEHAGYVHDVAQTPEDGGYLLALARGWDADLFGLVPGGDAVSGRAAHDWTPGGLSLVATHALLVCPRSEDDDVFTYLSRAGLVIRQSAEIRSRLSEEWQIALMWMALPHASKPAYRLRRFADLTL